MTKEEFAIKELKKLKTEIQKELKTYSYAFQIDEVNIIQDHIDLIDKQIKNLKK